MAKKLFVTVLVLGLLVGGLVWMLNKEGPGGDGTGDEGKLRVVTTTTMVTDMVKFIGGERVSVHGMMGAGVDPHSYQVRFPDTAALKKAEVVFYSGHHLEGKVQDVLEARAKAKGDVFAITDAIGEGDLLKPQEEFEKYYDPHIWGNVKLWSQCVDVVVRGLSEKDPEGAEQYEARGAEYRQQLLDLHDWVVKRVAEVPAGQRVLVTSHDAFFYFGKSYGFEVRGLQGISTNSEAGLRDRAELVRFIKERGIKMIFPESSVNNKGIEAVAEEAGVAVSEHALYSDAMGEPGDTVRLHGETYDRGTFVGMIKHNVNTVVDGLK